jgi:hypothetical protein
MSERPTDEDRDDLAAARVALREHHLKRAAAELRELIAQDSTIQAQLALDEIEAALSGGGSPPTDRRGDPPMSPEIEKLLDDIAAEVGEPTLRKVRKLRRALSGGGRCEHDWYRPMQSAATDVRTCRRCGAQWDATLRPGPDSRGRAEPGEGSTQRSGVTDAMGKLAELPANWDSYGAPPISADAMLRATVWLRNAQVVPCSDGGVQLEWHSEGCDVEITFRADGSTEAWAQERAALREAPPQTEGP